METKADKSTYACVKVFPMAERADMGVYDYRIYNCSECMKEANWLTSELKWEDGVVSMIKSAYCDEHLPDCYETFE